MPINAIILPGGPGFADIPRCSEWGWGTDSVQQAAQVFLTLLGPGLGDLGAQIDVDSFPHTVLVGLFSIRQQSACIPNGHSPPIARPSLAHISYTNDCERTANKLAFLLTTSEFPSYAFIRD